MVDCSCGGASDLCRWCGRTIMEFAQKALRQIFQVDNCQQSVNFTIIVNKYRMLCEF